MPIAFPLLLNQNRYNSNPTITRDVLCKPGYPPDFGSNITCPKKTKEKNFDKKPKTPDTGKKQKKNPKRRNRKTTKRERKY